MKFNLIKILCLGWLAALSGTSAHAANLDARELPACTGAALRIAAPPATTPGLSAADACFVEALLDAAAALVDNVVDYTADVVNAAVEVVLDVGVLVGVVVHDVVEFIVGAEEVSGGDEVY
jgi:hypothetical protein